MKKIILLSAVIFSCLQFCILLPLQAQILYGTTSNGGMDQGTIIKFIPATNSLSVTKSFSTRDARPLGDFVQAKDGKLYGMTSGGGSHDYGAIFSLDPSTATYQKLMNFNGANGKAPQGNLMQATDGNLYGMTPYGGSNGNGVIFSINPSTFTYTKLMDFDVTDGRFPTGSLIQASDGKLYGTATGGNHEYSEDWGVIFSFDISTSTYTKLKVFDPYNDGYAPRSLIQAKDGKLYGVTTYGLSSNGAIFSFDPSNSTFAKLKDFGIASEGQFPSGSLIQASNGKLYGMTGGSYGVGVIFSFDPTSSSYKRLKYFDIANGSSPYGSLLQANDGQLYGMTREGGTMRRGVIFSFNPSSNVYNKLKDFDDINGAYPQGSLVHASDGKLYGMTEQGGSGNEGVIFSFDPSSSTYKKLVDVAGNPDVGHPQGSLIQAGNGKLYGTANFIFSFNPLNSTYTRLNGYASGSLVQARDGKLYGTDNGNGRFGVIFSFDPSSSTYTVLRAFDGFNGAIPSDGLIQAKDGNLYGTTISWKSKDHRKKLHHYPLFLPP